MKKHFFGTDARHQTFKRDVDKLLKKHCARLPPDHLLAVAAQVVGQIVALQDQRTMTGERAMAIVAENIQEGNRAIMETLAKTKGSA